MRTVFLFATLCGCLIVTGCGIRGPLYLPEVPASSSAAPDVVDNTNPELQRNS